MLNNFSTTGAIEASASEITLMNTCKKFFEFKMYQCGCGITKVHFLGTLEDWTIIREKIKLLAKYDPPKVEKRYY